MKMKAFVEQDGRIYALHQSEQDVGPETYANAGRPLTLIEIPDEDIPSPDGVTGAQVLPEGWQERYS